MITTIPKDSTENMTTRTRCLLKFFKEQKEILEIKNILILLKLIERLKK